MYDKMLLNVSNECMSRSPRGSIHAHMTRIGAQGGGVNAVSAPHQNQMTHDSVGPRPKVALDLFEHDKATCTRSASNRLLHSSKRHS